ncbi:MAG: hypothetical protein J6R89_03395, partial [Clostridia bacterium]|nr:hypothetical protein [Clostridia bacterium]
MDFMYKICVDGACIEPQTIQTSAHPFNRTWPGAQRDASQCEIAYMLRLFGKGKKRIDVEADFCISEAIVRPLSKD